MSCALLMIVVAPASTSRRVRDGLACCPPTNPRTGMPAAIAAVTSCGLSSTTRQRDGSKCGARPVTWSESSTRSRSLLDAMHFGMVSEVSSVEEVCLDLDHDDFAVDQHAVAVEDDKFCWCCRQTMPRSHQRESAYAVTSAMNEASAHRHVSSLVISISSPSVSPRLSRTWS